MNELESKAEDWVRYFKVCGLSMANLKNILKHDGEPMLRLVLKKMHLGTAMDVIKGCDDS